MEKDKKLFEKYLDGETSLKEEQALFDKSNKEDPSIDLWARYAKSVKVAAPADLNKTLWNPEMYKSKKTIWKYIYAGVIILIVALAGFLISDYNKAEELDYATKKMLLEQAIAMTAPDITIPAQKEILYEDELIIIYMP